jgi:glutathione S-transferase
MASKNPLTKVPILELDDKIVFESLITADYLDELYPGSRLLNNSDPFKKAQDRIFIELFQQVKFNNLAYFIIIKPVMKCMYLFKY